MNSVAPPGERSTVESLAAGLEMPLLAMVDVRRCDPCQWPTIPAGCEGVLLDGIDDARTFAYWKTACEAMHDLPVVGAMTACPELRTQIKSGKLPRELFRHFGQEFLRYTDLAEIAKIAQAAAPPSPSLPRRGCRLKRNALAGRTGGLRIAVAYDDAFQCYFPDIFDELESAGATILDFSPLADECLPPDVDLVYVGCGMVEAHAERLAENTCMATALRDHVCAGKRLYAEGGGAAYLCDGIFTADGRSRPMLGILPAIARSNPRPTRARACEAKLKNASWLGARGEMLRGYRSDRWTFEARDPSFVLGTDERGETELLARHHAVGGRLQLNFAADELLLAALLKPCPAALAWAGAVTIKRRSLLGRRTAEGFGFAL
ncbi:MAG: hypothetical protein QM811_19485 [Pirellulales bacterium]